MGKFFASLAAMAMCAGVCASEEIEILDLDMIPYAAFAQDDPNALSQLERALHEKGIVGIRGVPGYRQKVVAFIRAARSFSALSEKVKEAYAPDRSRGDTFLGYEKGKERFKRPDGSWVVDDLKVSYYASVPDNALNHWPKEVDLRDPFLAIGSLMSEVGEAVMRKIGLIQGFSLDHVPRCGRMLYYRKGEQSAAENPFWCGAHFDHGLFTVLLPAFYFIGGRHIQEPLEAGLFVKTTADGKFKKVVASDPDVMLFQVGEFGQLISNDGIHATEHRVHKASGSVERYTLALFFDAPADLVIRSTSELTQDARYGGEAGSPCSYKHWSDESFKRYLAQ